MSKLHRDNAGYVGCSYEETQDPYYSYNKLSLPLAESDKTVLYDEVTFTVTVAGGKFVIDGTSQATVSLIEGNVYTFDQSDSSNIGHPLRFSYTEDGTHGDGQEYTLGVTINGTPGSAGAYTKIVVPFGLHDLYYYCSVHSGYGGFANVAKGVYKFTTGLPVLKTTDAFGETLGTGNNEDPFAANLALAIPMNGANDGTTFTDVSSVIRGSGSAHSITRYGAVTKTGESKLYGSSGFFDGINDRLVVAYDPNYFDPGSGDYTVEAWVKWNSGQAGHIMSWHGGGVSSRFDLGCLTAGNLRFFINNGTSYTFTVSVDTGRWLHVAAQKRGDQMELFVDGSLAGRTTMTGDWPAASSTGPIIGLRDPSTGSFDYMNGYIQDVRIYKGVAKYTTPFPTGSYGMDVVTYTGNGGTQKIGGPVYSNYTSAPSSYNGSAANLFDGDTSTAWQNTDTSGNTYASVDLTQGGKTSGIAFSQSFEMYGAFSYNQVLEIDHAGGTYTYNSNPGGSGAWVDFTSNLTSPVTAVRFKDSGGTGTPSWNAIRVDNEILRDGNDAQINFQPDLVWMSARDATGYIKYIFDSVRGATKALATSHIQGDDAETTLSDGLTSFNSDGFTLGSNASSNENNRSMVAWGWKAGGAPTTDNVAGAGNVPTAGSVKIDGANMTTSLAGTIPATRLTASTKYGFSIVEYEGNGTSGSTVAHGITNATPKMVWMKNRDTDSTDWRVYTTAIDGSLDFMFLNLTDSKTNSGLTAFTNTTFTVGSSNESNGNNDSMIAYCWSEVSGFSKFNSYSGNGSTQVITTGFKPAWIMFKRYDSNAAGADWYILDSKRFSGTQEYLLSPNNNVAETGTLADYVVLNDDGFTLQTGTTLNGSGRSYIYAAFAESAPGDAAFESALVDQLDLKDRSGNSNNASNEGVTWQTSVEKFYGGAADFDGTGSKLTMPGNADFDFGTGDFTIEAWAYLTGNGSNPILISSGDYYGSASGNWLIRRTTASTIAFATYDGQANGEYAELSASTSLNTWHHIAMVRNGNTVQVFVDGIPGGTVTVTKSLSDAATNGMNIGWGNINGYWPGYIQDMRIYKGIAKYTSQFSPPERSVQGTARRYPSGIYVVS